MDPIKRMIKSTDNVIVNLTLVSFTVVLSEDINFIYLNENKS